MTDDIEASIEAALEELRPALQFDGGDIDLLGWSDDTGIATVSMTGACHGCSMSAVTLQAGIERIVKERVPEVKAIVNIPPEGEPTNPKY
jgi:Fe-S cluster biogenesis protein NfuA